MEGGSSLQSLSLRGTLEGCCVQERTTSTAGRGQTSGGQAKPQRNATHPPPAPTPSPPSGPPLPLPSFSRENGAVQLQTAEGQVAHRMPEAEWASLVLWFHSRDPR